MNTAEELARRKRRIERLLRGIGFSRAEAKLGATKIFTGASLPYGMQAERHPSSTRNSLSFQRQRA